MKELTPIEIRDQLMNGDLNPERARELFQEIRDKKADVIAYQPRKRGGFDAIARVRQATGYVFNHGMAYEHYLDRKDVEEGFKHVIGTVIYGATGIIDGTLEGVVYAATEIAETGSFAVARTINRVRDGWVRGLQDRG